MASCLLAWWREAGRDVVTIAMAKKKWGRERQKQLLLARIHRAKQARVASSPAGSGGPIEGRAREATPAERAPAVASTSGTFRVQEVLPTNTEIGNRICT